MALVKQAQVRRYHNKAAIRKSRLDQTHSPPSTKTHNEQEALDAGDYAAVFALLPGDPATAPAPYPLLVCYGAAATQAGMHEVRCVNGSCLVMWCFGRGLLHVRSNS